MTPRHATLAADIRLPVPSILVSIDVIALGELEVDGEVTDCATGERVSTAGPALVSLVLHAGADGMKWSSSGSPGRCGGCTR